MPTLVLLRHGESVWNAKDLFTGWTDVDLTAKGLAEAHTAGSALAAEGLTFDQAYTSVLKRAIKTLNETLEAMDLLWLPVEKSWRLNERHYGALQGLNKAETASRCGEDVVAAWRRSWDTPPPRMSPAQMQILSQDRRYAGVAAAALPFSESLKDTVDRIMPFWTETIAPALRRGQRTLLVAHGNSLRGLVKVLSGISDQDICTFHIPTGNPLVYTLDDALQPTSRRFVGSPRG